MSSPTKAPVERRHREIAALTLSTGPKLEDHVSRWVAGEETAHRVFGDLDQALADIEAAAEARCSRRYRSLLEHLEHCALDHQAFRRCERRAFGMILSRAEALESAGFASPAAEEPKEPA